MENEVGEARISIKQGRNTELSSENLTVRDEGDLGYNNFEDNIEMGLLAYTEVQSFIFTTFSCRSRCCFTCGNETINNEVPSQLKPMRILRIVSRAVRSGLTVQSTLMTCGWTQRGGFVLYLHNDALKRSNKSEKNVIWRSHYTTARYHNMNICMVSPVQGDTERQEEADGTPHALNDRYGMLGEVYVKEHLRGVNGLQGSTQ